MQARDIVQFLRNSEQVIERGFFYVFPKLGISIDRDVEQIIGFDKRIAVYWENIHRPITSWYCPKKCVSFPVPPPFC